MKNLCHFSIVICGDLFPAHATPLRFTPVLTGDGPVKTLLGYEPPKDLPTLPAGTQVIVPRFAAAVSWARSAGLVPLTVRQEHLGQRGRPGAPDLVVSSVEEGLEHAPEGLAFEFLTEAAPSLWPGRIARLVQGDWPIMARGVGRFEAPTRTECAYDLDDGSAYLPESLASLAAQLDAVIVPQSGAVIRALQAQYPGLGVLVTGVADPVTKEVDLYRVA